MYVHDNRQGRQRHRWRPAITSMLMLALASFSHAADFDEKLKAPMMKDAGELRSQAQAYAARFAAAREASIEQLVRDPALAREKFDVAWKVQRAIDQRKPIDELAESGITLQPNGSYAVDTAAHPEWVDLANTITALLTGENQQYWIPLLIARGFRPQDVEILKSYAQGHDPLKASAAAALPIALSFGRAVRKYDKLKRPVPDALVHSFWYQRSFAASESDRAWVLGLMQVLDAQPQRILVSTFAELKHQMYWIPEDMPEGVASILAEVRRPDFEAMAISEAGGAAK
ncbi:MAG TPA: hypothetical protein VFV88_03980 [Steroidobacteraceae bacterium]|jgi:hypothetical protein|nr:hypothetical protein [Steroidobacteraceae bacterium]